MFKKSRKKMNSGEKENDKNLKEEAQKEKEINSEDQSAETSETDEKDKKIKELEDQVNLLNDKYLRLYSEFDNYRKRTAKEKIETVATAGAEIIDSLLPVIDDFERALKSSESPTDIEAIKEGISLIYHKIINTLSKKGLEPMKSIGEPFDPEFHEAITNIPAPNEEMIGKIIDEAEKGYLLNGKVIRYAKVVVGN